MDAGWAAADGNGGHLFRPGGKSSGSVQKLNSKGTREEKYQVSRAGGLAWMTLILNEDHGTATNSFAFTGLKRAEGGVHPWFDVGTLDSVCLCSSPSTT